MATLLLCARVALGAPLVAQRPALPHGLKAGRHDVGARRFPLPQGGSLVVWYPAACGRRPAAPSAPCADAPADSGTWPALLVVAGDGGAGPPDTVLAVYLATHGYVVARGSTGLDDAMHAVRALGFVDSSRMAILGRGSGAALARGFAERTAWVGALVELEPEDSAAARAAVRSPTLVVRLRESGPAPTSSRARMTVDLPWLPLRRDGQPADQRRLVAAVTRAFLDGALRGWGSPLPELAARLNAAGLRADFAASPP